MGKQSFAGFQPEAFDFLAMVRLNDSKLWYDEHKDEYRRLLLEPFQRLVADLGDTAHKLDEQFVTIPAVGKTISRLRRDTRFTSDKSLYRDTMWFAFRRRDAETGRPAFFFELSPVHYCFGMGFYSPDPESMRLFRARILSNQEEFRKAVGFLKGRFGFRLEGEFYKRDLFPGAPDDLKPWLKLKGFYVGKERHDIGRLYRPDLPEELKKGFLMLKPLYDFVLRSVLTAEE